MDLRTIKSLRPLCGVNLTQPEISYPESHDFLSTFPTEMFRAILGRVQTLELIPLRLVSNRWKVVIESICSDKKCVVVMHHWDKYYLRELLKQFNLKELSKNSVVFKLKYNQHNEIHLFGHFCSLLSKLFPRLEQLYILDYITCSFAEFNSMLRQWSPSLTSLCVRFHYSEDVNDLCTQINQLTNLKQLNLDSLSATANQLAPTLARLEHFSGSGHESMDKISPYFGASISSFGSIYRHVSLEELISWHHQSAQTVSNIVRFAFHTDDPEMFPFISKHFSSLQMVRTYMRDGLKLTTRIMEHLTRLTHLTDLQIDNLTIDSTFLDVTNPKPLRNIRFLTLMDLYIDGGGRFFDFDLPENVFRLCRFLSIIFPNVERLIIEDLVYYPQFAHLLASHVNLFANLRSHNFKLNDSIDHSAGLDDK